MFEAIDRLVHTGDPATAVHQLRRLLVLHPALQPAYARLAELTGEADVFEHAAALAPGSAHAALVAGHALQRAGRLEAAALRIKAAARLVPSGELLSELGIVLKQAGRRPEALAAYIHAVRVAPAHAQAYNNLGVALQEAGDARGARRAYAAALRAAPRLSAAVPLNLLRCELNAALWARWPLHEWFASRRPGRRHKGASAWVLAAWGRLEARAYLTADPLLLHASARAEAAAVAASAAAEWHCAGAASCRGAGARHAAVPPAGLATLRVAVLSDLDADPSARLLRRALPLLGAGRASRLHVTLLSTTTPPGSEHLQQLRRARALRVVDLPPAAVGLAAADGDGTAPAARGLCEAEAALAAAAPHVLLEVMNYLPGNQLPLLARRCAAAPVHTSWLRNFHGSMAAPFVHYAVVDRMVLLPREARTWAEAPIWLPHSHLVNGHMLERWARTPLTPDAVRQRRPSRRRPRKAGEAALGVAAGEGAVATACSFNRLNKLEPALMHVWASGVARARAQLVMATGAPAVVAAGGSGERQAEVALASETAALGLAPRRVRFAHRTASDAAHSARVARCALALDARVWGAHTTGLDALAAGVGLLSVRGPHLASRAATSLLSALGVPALATHSLRAYSDAIATLLARDAPARRSAPSPTRARGARDSARTAQQAAQPTRIEVSL